ncbi:MAG: ECF-type sigma factor [Planctomycetaceae bacterium]
MLSQIDAGDPTASEKLLPLVYDDLRKLATSRMASETFKLNPVGQSRANLGGQCTATWVGRIAPIS